MARFFTFLLSLVASLIIGFYVLWALEALETKYVFALTFSIIVFCLINLYVSYEKSFSLSLRLKTPVELFLLGWFLAIVLTILIPPVAMSQQFLIWNELPIFTWLRLFATFLLTTIYPGYAITSILSKGKNLNLLEGTIFSILLSILITSTIGFIGVIVDGFIGNLSLFVLILVNALLFITILLRRRYCNTRIKDFILNVKLPTIINVVLLFTLLTFVLLSFYSVNFPDKFVSGIDEWAHYGQILKALNGTFFSSLKPSSYWFHMYEGLLIFGAGAPPANTYLLSFFLTLLPILSFYLLCKAFWDHRKALVSTVIYTLFAGLGGFYADYLRAAGGRALIWSIGQAASKTYDIYAGAVSFSFYLFPKLVGFSVLFVLIYLMYDQKLNKLNKIVLVSFIFALGYLSHFAEVFLFLVFFSSALLLSKEYISDSDSIFSGLVIGLVFVGAVDFLAPKKVYFLYDLLTGHFNVSLVLIGLVILSYLLSHLKLSLSHVKNKKFIGEHIKHISLPIIAIFTYFYFLSIIIWIFVYSNFDIAYTIGDLGKIFVWYLYPVRLGFALLMAIFGSYELLRNGEIKVLKVALTILLIAICIERVSSYATANNLPQLILMEPVRVVEYAWIGIAMLATPAFSKVLEKVAKINHKIRTKIYSILISILLIGMIIIGSSSTLYNVEIRSMSTTLTKSEMDALNYLLTNTKSNITILAFGSSANKINNFGGRYAIDSYHSAIILAISDYSAFIEMPEYLYKLYNHFPIEYLWLSKSDIENLEKNYESSFLTSLINYLPIAYENDEIVIFKVPYFSAPLENSNLISLMNPFDFPDQSLNSLYIYEGLALSGLNYSTKPFISDLTGKTIVLPMDPDVSKGDLTFKKLMNSSASEFLVFNSLGHNAKPSISGFGPSVYEVKSGRYLRTRYLYRSAEEIIFYLDVSGNTAYNITNYPYAWLFLNVTSARGLTKPSVIKTNTFVYLGNCAPNETYRVYWTVNSLYQPVGWKDECFAGGWSIAINKPESGNIDVFNNGSLAIIAFNALSKNVWQYFLLDVPDVEVSVNRYLILKEAIESYNYNLGFLRIIIGGYTYTVRGWTYDTISPGHPWKTYVFDLREAIPEKSDAPIPPQGPITKISWTGYSTGEGGGTAKLYLDYIMLANQMPVLPADIMTLNDFEDGNEDHVVYSGTRSMRLLRGEYYNLSENNADYLGVALYGSGYINGERFSHNYWQYYWVKGNKLDITSRDSCYIDKVTGIRIDSALDDRVMDGLENPVPVRFKERFGYFATDFSISISSEKRYKVVNSIVGPGGNISFPPIEVPLFDFNRSEILPVAFYAINGELVSPYAFLKKTDNYEILYVEIYPFLKSLNERVATYEGREMFTKLGDLVKVLGFHPSEHSLKENAVELIVFYGETALTGNISISSNYVYIPSLDQSLLQSIGWRADWSAIGWGTTINNPSYGSMNISLDDVLKAEFKAFSKDVWQSFFLNVPNVDVSRYPYLIMREKIDCDSYALGYLRVVVGGYVYGVRGWTAETKPPGHPWKTYVFDLRNAVPEKSDAPKIPEGRITQISWTGYSTGEDGGTANLYLDYIMLANNFLASTATYDGIMVSLDVSKAGTILIDGQSLSENKLINMRILNMQFSGSYNSSILTTETKLLPPGLGGYSRIIFDRGFNLTIWLTNESKLDIEGAVGGIHKSITVTGGSVTLSIVPSKGELVVYSYSPLISVDGLIKIEKVFISGLYGGDIGFYTPMLRAEIEGLTSFRVKLMDKDFSLVSGLMVDGVYKVFLQQVRWNEWDIPWLAVLSSPYHLLLIFVIIAIVSVNKIKKQYRFKIKLKLGSS